MISEEKDTKTLKGIKIRNAVILILLVVIALMNCIYLMLHSIRNNIPSRPSNIPKTAIWYGELNRGGAFFDLVEVRDSVYRFKIYSDESGELLIDADYKLLPFEITEDNWSKTILHPKYDLFNDSLKDVTFKPYMRLKMITPAYGGKDWEIIKGKYDLNYE